jgi:hypothetical protein
MASEDFAMSLSPSELSDKTVLDTLTSFHNLTNLLQQSRTSRSFDTRFFHPSDGSTAREPRRIWETFLDYLCWLCDFECGGDTVTSIAVERKDDIAVFWVATNSSSGERAIAHLRFVLEVLQAYCYDPFPDSCTTVKRMFARSVEQGAGRANNYVRILDGLITGLDDKENVSTTRESKSGSSNCITKQSKLDNS